MAGGPAVYPACSEANIAHPFPGGPSMKTGNFPQLALPPAPSVRSAETADRGKSDCLIPRKAACGRKSPTSWLGGVRAEAPNHVLPVHENDTLYVVGTATSDLNQPDEQVAREPFLRTSPNFRVGELNQADGPTRRPQGRVGFQDGWDRRCEPGGGASSCAWTTLRNCLATCR